MINRIKNIFKRKNTLDSMSYRKAWLLIDLSLIFYTILVMFTSQMLNSVMSAAQLMASEYNESWILICAYSPLFWSLIALIVIEIFILGEFIIKDSIKLLDRAKIVESNKTTAV